VTLGLGLELTKLKMKTTLLRIESCDTNQIERGLERLSGILGNARVLISGFRTFQLVPMPMRAWKTHAPSPRAGEESVLVPSDSVQCLMGMPVREAEQYT
jgi:hypothetical protein